MTDMVDFNGSDDQCAQFAAVVTHPLYRSMQLVHLGFSILSIFLLIHVLSVVKKRLSFHYNMKILFVSLLCATMFHSFWITTFTCHHIIISFTYRNDCDVVLKTNIYQFFNIPLVTAILWIEFTTILMFAERCIATLFYKCYEKSGRRLGQFLLLLSVIIPSIFTFWVRYKTVVTEPQISALNTPTAAASRVTLLFVLFSFLNVIAAFSSGGLYLYNKKNASKLSESLTAKYQIAENSVSSKFMAAVIAGTLAFMAIYGGATSYLKLTQDKAKLVDVYYKSYIMMAYTVPIYTCILPIIVFYGIKQMEKRRHNKVDNLIQVQAIGEQGWNNYAEQLRLQWS